MSEKVEVKVFTESRYWVECPKCGAEFDIETYVDTEEKCCGITMTYNNDPHNAEAV